MTSLNHSLSRLVGFSRWVAPILCCMVALATSTAPADALLSYNLPSDLKKSSCANDTDNDCLDNNEEGNLAMALAPLQFYDEDEDCSGWTNKWGLPSSHFQRRDYFQVRPSGSGIQNWSPTDGKAKWIQVTYFLLYPHDCQSYFGFGGHQGDSENIRYYLYSYDLQRWYLSSARYWHHGSSHTISGSTLATHAGQLGTTRPSVASDEDGHGSWAGYKTDSSDCAGSEDSSWNDCFINDWDEDYANGNWEYVQATKNVGGPSPETWNSSTITVSGSTAYTTLDVGHGSNREYWTPRTDKYKKFCGWQCASWERKTDGDCTASRHSESSCADGPLSNKVDSVSFSLQPPPPPTSCAGYCGSYTGACDCTPSCVYNGNCCNDYNTFCGQGPCLLRFSVEGTEASLLPTPCEEATLAGRSEAAERVAAERGARMVEAAAGELLREAARQTPANKWERQRLLHLASDPIAAVLPMLVDTTPTQKLRTLKWMLRFEDAGQWVSLFPDLNDRVGRAPRLAAGFEAADRLKDLVALLEAHGYSSPDLGDDFVVSEITDAEELEPNPR